MSRASKILVFLLLLLGAAAVLAASLLRRGYSARAEPSRVEMAVARRLRHLATPREAREAKNPVAPSLEAMAEARAHFADHCALCHANDGGGQTEIGQGLYPKAPDMRRRETQELSDGELFYIIRNGVRFTGMPGWGTGPEEKDTESWALVHFIRHLPNIAPEEIREMESLNPKSPHESEEEQEAEKFLRGEPTMPPSPHEHEHKH